MSSLSHATSMKSEAPFKHALLVEDEPNLAFSLLIALKRMNISVDLAKSLGSASSKVQSETPSKYDLILLDRMLPDGDGLDLCELIRAQHYTGSILFLSALGEVEERIKGLDRGADDYLAKPFSIEELEARIRALSRRAALTQLKVKKSQESSTWLLNESLLEVSSPSGTHCLTPLEFKLMQKLIKSDGSIIGRDQLLKEVWGFDLLPQTRSVDLFIARMRKLFEPNPEKPRYILTVRGAGYRFVQGTS